MQSDVGQAFQLKLSIRKSDGVRYFIDGLSSIEVRLTPTAAWSTGTCHRQVILFHHSSSEDDIALGQVQ